MNNNTNSIYKYESVSNLRNLAEAKRIFKTKSDLMPILFEMMRLLTTASSLEKCNIKLNDHCFGLTLSKDEPRRFYYFRDSKQFYSFNNPFDTSFIDGNFYFSIDSMNLDLDFEKILLLENLFRLTSPFVYWPDNLDSNYRTIPKNQMNFWQFEQIFIDQCEQFSLPELNDQENIQKWWNLIYMLLTFEIGYIRYDIDPEHEKENHPKNHFDINLSNSVKFGIKQNIQSSEFIHFLNSKENVYYIKYK
ncbi:hypothetical protein ACT5YT_05175 [Leuconostoc suionicum]|uniref:hypothetical protein n=1 Tax=Leuconostoc suionicum TaxID=1511761 RepID=UPI004035E771